jgi:hypothetical protein
LDFLKQGKMLLIRFFIFSILFFNNLDDVPKDKTIFKSPLKIPQLLSANFGELRADHFHSGLDIKTQGVTGKEVVAAADGFVSRISVAPGGFGNAVYITHPTGYSTVYGHLNRFSPEIEKYVKDHQYEKKSFTITLFPQKDEFPVKQGELIAWSGNSGSSGGPHVHFEIRKSDSEKPVNPLLFDFGMADNIKPVIEKLVIYPANRFTLINNENESKRITVSGGNGAYFIPAANEISISGLAGFGIKAYDLLNESNNRCAVYAIELKVDSITIFKYVMDAFAFTESRFVNSHIDYETFMKENTYIERAFVLPNDRLSVYRSVVHRGLFNFDDSKSHSAEIIATDVSGNKSTLKFRIKAPASRRKLIVTLADSDIRVMPYNKTNTFSAENIAVNIPAGALYDTLNFSYRKEKGTSNMLSDIHYVHNKYTPVQKAYTLSIKPTSIPVGKESKMLLIQLVADHRIAISRSVWTEGYISADVLAFGRYYIGIDTIPPVISANGLTNGVNLSGRKELRIRISDELSGIKSYEGTIDGNWALFEYDQKNDLLTYSFDDTRIKKGSKHNLLLKVTDNRDNVSTFKCSFTW